MLTRRALNLNIHAPNLAHPVADPHLDPFAGRRVGDPSRVGYPSRAPPPPPRTPMRATPAQRVRALAHPTTRDPRAPRARHRDIRASNASNEDADARTSNELEPIDARANAYEVLRVRESANDQEIRAAYLSLSKAYHPDVRRASIVDDSQAMINRAYDALLEPTSRRKLDDALREARKKVDGRRGDGTTAVKPGLVGPIVSNEVVVLDVCQADACATDAVETTVDSIRQWARTLAFTSELPLPLPLSVDDLPAGARLAFMRYSAGEGLREAGALCMEVAEEAFGTRVIVKRSFAKSSEASRGEIPGEARVMASFIEEFKFFISGVDARTVTESKPRGLGGIGSAVAAFFLPGLPIFGATRSAPGGAYTAYNLRHDAKHID